MVYTRDDQPMKFENGTPQYPPPSCQINDWSRMARGGSIDRSQLTMMKLASTGTAERS